MKFQVSWIQQGVSNLWIVLKLKKNSENKFSWPMKTQFYCFLGFSLLVVTKYKFMAFSWTTIYFIIANSALFPWSAKILENLKHNSCFFSLYRQHPWSLKTQVSQAISWPAITKYKFMAFSWTMIYCIAGNSALFHGLLKKLENLKQFIVFS